MCVLWPRSDGKFGGQTPPGFGQNGKVGWGGDRAPRLSMGLTSGVREVGYLPRYWGLLRGLKARPHWVGFNVTQDGLCEGW